MSDYMLHSTEAPFLFLGNDNCLDFLNTLIVEKGQSVDLIQSFDDLLRWLVDAKMLDRATAAILAERWLGSAEASDAIAEAHALRAQLLATVDGLIAGVSSSFNTIDALNAILQRLTGYEQIVTAPKTSGQWMIETRHAYREPRDVLVPLAHAAAVLLCDRESGRIKACENPACVLHYYDTSKNGGRRWCDTRTCGNRIRVAQHYHRQHTR
jgi:predicted RNA-binding Zn ribbon-like protein